jgi:hypothetical protein
LELGKCHWPLQAALSGSLIKAPGFAGGYLLGRDENGEVIVETLLANYVNRMPNVADQAKDLEVAYIGKGLRNSAQDRLRHHETLQRLLADLSATEPHSEIFALVYAFKCRKQTLIFPNATTEFTGDAAAKRWARALAYRPSVGEQTALVEACCISYFRPEKYNTHYLDFPTGTYQILGPLHDADFAGLLVQLDNTSIDGQRVYSRIVRPASIHDIVIDFRRLEHRYSFISKP